MGAASMGRLRATPPRHWASLWASLAFVVSGLVTPACASTPMREGTLYAGRADADPSMECLPDPDVADAAYTPHMVRGRELAQSSFEVPDPPLPPDRTAQTLTAWADSALRTWIQAKTQAVDAAREELDLAAEENHRQRIIGGAIVGLMHEDIGRIIAAVPIPDDLDDEPEILEAFRHVIQGQAEPYFRLARQAYHACALNAVQPEGMQHWSAFCRQRMDNLPDDPSMEDAPEGTTVEVLHD